jgi:hypothetical protein
MHLLLVRLGERPERVRCAGGDHGEVIDQAAETEDVIVHLHEVLDRWFGDAVDDLLTAALQERQRSP